jgi:hypothetical protein
MNALSRNGHASHKGPQLSAPLDRNVAPSCGPRGRLVSGSPLNLVRSPRGSLMSGRELPDRTSLFRVCCMECLRVFVISILPASSIRSALTTSVGIKAEYVMAAVPKQRVVLAR